MKRLLIRNATLVNEGEEFRGSLVVEGEQIAEVLRGDDVPQGAVDETVDATGCYLIPGVIDDHVHLREPGLTQKADIHSESRAMAAGGVTSYMDMPNVVPQTTTVENWEAKERLGAERSIVNYAFHFGATNSNADLLPHLDTRRVCAVKLFMGASTGNMLVDKAEALKKIFSCSPLPIMTHCEDTSLILRNMEACKAQYGADPPLPCHPQIRSEEACYASSSLAVELAKSTGARLHIAHISTARELSLFDEYRTLDEADAVPQITAEACIGHLMFSDEDYATLGTRIKCNPAIKSRTDRDALRRALCDGSIYLIGTDHAPHLPSEKVGGCAKAASGMPMVQFSLVCMLSLVDEGVLPLTRLVTLMCHHPARLFDVAGRGYLRKGYQADLALVRPDAPWTLRKSDIESKCGWSPLEGRTFNWQVAGTWCNGHRIYDGHNIDDGYRGQALVFEP